MPQVIDCQIVEEKQINAAFFSFFHNEINIVKCGEILNLVKKESDDKPKNSPNINNLVEELLTVFPK